MFVQNVIVVSVIHNITKDKPKPKPLHLKWATANNLTLLLHVKSDPDQVQEGAMTMPKHTSHQPLPNVCQTHVQTSSIILFTYLELDMPWTLRHFNTRETNCKFQEIKLGNNTSNQNH